MLQIGPAALQNRPEMVQHESGLCLNATGLQFASCGVCWPLTGSKEKNHLREQLWNIVLRALALRSLQPFKQVILLGVNITVCRAESFFYS